MLTGPKRTARSRLKPVAWLLLRGALLIGSLAALSALALYVLALMALDDLAAAARPERQHATAASGLSVAAMGDGMTKVHMGDGTAFELGGHGAPVVAAEIAGGGALMVSADAMGHVRITALDAAHTLHDRSMTTFAARLGDTLWRPYGQSAARWALDVVAQVLPLHIPDSLKGRRGRIFKDCDVCPEMVEIEPGMFFMGSPLTEWEREADEGPRRLVSISQPFAVGRFEVTFDEWDACVAAKSCPRIGGPGASKGRGRQPVGSVSWVDAYEYVLWLNSQTTVIGPHSGLKSDFEYDLLTEVEWEYVSRAGSTSKFGFANDSTELCRLGNVADISARQDRLSQTLADCNDLHPGLAEVGQYYPNHFGVHDLQGNVWEWVGSCYHDVLKGSNVAGDLLDTRCERVFRGGSAEASPKFQRAAERGRGTATGTLQYRAPDLGFRVAKRRIRE